MVATPGADAGSVTESGVRAQGGSLLVLVIDPQVPAQLVQGLILLAALGLGHSGGPGHIPDAVALAVALPLNPGQVGVPLPQVTAGVPQVEGLAVVVTLEGSSVR